MEEAQTSSPTQTNPNPNSPDLASQGQALRATEQTENPKRKIPFLKILIFGFVIIITILAFSLIAYLLKGQNKNQAINNYEECVAAGFPIMESYPEQCAANGQTFTRILTEEEQKKLDPTAIPELTPLPTLTASETATWKTYNASYDNFSFKYPPTVNVLEDENNGKKFRTFIQDSDTQIVIYPNGLTGESSLEAYRDNLTSLGANNFMPINIDGKNGFKYQIIQKEENTIGVILINNEKLYQITISPSNIQNASYLDQLLSTFKFTQ